MNDNFLTRSGLIILLIFTILLSFAYFNRKSDRVVKIIRVPDPNYIPSAREIQQRLTDLNDPRYDPNGVDGVIGKDSRTAWDNLIKDRYAKRAVEGE